MNDRRKKGLEKEISRIIGTLLLTEVKNEKVKNYVSIHHVSLTKDGRYLDLTFSILDLKNTVNKEKMMEELTKLKGYFRKNIGDRLSIRHVPEVRIHLDDTIEYGVKISAILNEIKQKGNELSQ
ncbi:MAG: 30S ribosome-binding factor RbfA, partial [Leptotrichiaceae bacterium]